jgi:hypothetical protein
MHPIIKFCAALFIDAVNVAIIAPFRIIRIGILVCVGAENHAFLVVFVCHNVSVLITYIKPRLI